MQKNMFKKIIDENKKVYFKVLKHLAYILSIIKRKEIEKTIDLYKQAIVVIKNYDIVILISRITFFTIT